jgi:pimeloyl-ACP methyl ester carboxylesterase
MSLVSNSSREQQPRSGVQTLASLAHPDQEYLLYVPPLHNDAGTFRLLVIVHGYSRRALEYTEAFVPFADRHEYILLAPVFSATNKYQVLGVGGSFRADLRLLRLVDEVGARFPLQDNRFDLFGYSGGGQFAHRFLYVHPGRLRAVVVGAPGTVTLPTERERWPAGVANLRQVVGRPFDVAVVRRPAVMLVVGSNDVTLDGLNQERWAMRTGATRLGRARALHAAWQVAGLEQQYVEVAGAGHGLTRPLLEAVYQFLAAGPPS